MSPPLDLFEHAYRETRQLNLPPLVSKLVDIAKTRRVSVRFGIWFGPREPRAEFISRHHERYGFTSITLRTRGGVHKVFDTPHAITLAHELGHHTAWSRGEDDAEYTRVASTDPGSLATWAKSSPAAARAMLEAEARAWRYAHDELTAIGFEDWLHFNRVAAVAYGSYLRHLSPVTEH